MGDDQPTWSYSRESYAGHSAADPFRDPARAYPSSQTPSASLGLSSSSRASLRHASGSASRQTPDYSPDSSQLPLNDQAIATGERSTPYYNSDPSSYHPYPEEYFQSTDNLHLVESGPSTCE